MIETAAHYVQWTEDALNESWEAGNSNEYRALSVARAQVYATLALTAATLQIKEKEK